jgi:hypothetical protein
MAVALFLLVGIGWVLFTGYSRNRELSRELVAKSIGYQIAVAIHAYHQEYGEWPPFPFHPETKLAKDAWYGHQHTGAPARTNLILFPLRGIAKGPNTDYAANPQKIVFFEAMSARFSRDGKPRNGVVNRGPDDQLPSPDLESCIFDPWGHEYGIVIDTNGDERLDLTGIYNDFTGEAAPRKRVGVFSMGKDGTLGANGDRLYRKGPVKSDDVVSWE